MSRKIFSLAAEEADYFNSEKDKIELVQCPQDKKQCVKQLPDINKCFHASHQHRLDKDYQQAIEALKNAFDITYEIHEEDCMECASFFRSVIVSSMELLHSELKDLATGWFRNKHYVPDLEMATRNLQEMKSKIMGNEES